LIRENSRRVVPSPATSEVLKRLREQLSTHIFIRIFQLDLFRDRHTILVIVGLPNFLSRITLRPLGPSVALTAFASFSTPRQQVCRAASSEFNCLAAKS